MSAIHDHEYFAEHCDDRDVSFHTECEVCTVDCEGEPVNPLYSHLCAYHLRQVIVAGLVANNDTMSDLNADAIAWAETFFRSDAGLNYVRSELERGSGLGVK